MATAHHFDVSTSTLQQWTRYRNFPMDCRVRDGQHVMWDVEALKQWLRGRPISKRGARPRWLGIVGHEAA
jgi:phage terminase Nu1 subunit (DNA packaging protein)